LHRSENKVESLTGESRRAVQMKLNTTLILPLSNERDARDVSKRSNRWGWRGSLVFSFTVYGVYCHDMFLRIALFRVWAWWHLLLWCVCHCTHTHTHTLVIRGRASSSLLTVQKAESLILLFTRNAK